MQTKHPRKLTRRQFVLENVVGGALLVVTSCNSPDSHTQKSNAEFDYETILVKNPAFIRRSHQGLLFLSSMTSRNKSIIYRIDEGASYLWDKVPTPEQFLQGKKITAQQLIDDAVEKYESQQQYQHIHRDVLAFLQKSIQECILVDSNKRIYCSYIPPHRV